jgi:hypothetical protein
VCILWHCSYHRRDGFFILFCSVYLERLQRWKTDMGGQRNERDWGTWCKIHKELRNVVFLNYVFSSITFPMLSQKSPPPSSPPPLPYSPTPIFWPWRSPVLGHIKFAWPMGLSFQWWPTRPSFDVFAISTSKQIAVLTFLFQSLDPWISFLLKMFAFLLMYWLWKGIYYLKNIPKRQVKKWWT